MQVRLTTDSSGKCADSARIVAAARSVGLELATREEIYQLRDVAAALFDSGIAPALTFDSVNQRTGASVFGYRPGGMLQGFLAIIPLRPEGVAQLKAGVFDGLTVDLDLVCEQGEAPAALYFWGWATVNSRATLAIVEAFRELRRALFWATPVYARLAAEAGARIAQRRMNYVPCADAADGTLNLSDVYGSFDEAAA